MKKSLTAIIALVMVVCMAVPAFAASVCVGTYDWTIPTRETTWNGKDKGCLFGLFDGDATWTVKNNKTSPSVNAELLRVLKWLPDQYVASLSKITSTKSTSFVAGSENGYYAVITDSSSIGATGSTYINQDSSITG